MFQKSFDVVTFGSGAIDLFVDADVNETNNKLTFTQGSKNFIRHLEQHVGGGGTNSAVAFSRLGFRTGWIGKVGKDYFGTTILKCIKKEKIIFLGSKSKNESGISVIITAKEKDRVILTYKGCNDEISFKDFSLKKIKTRWIYFSSLMKSSFETQKKLAKMKKKEGVKIAFNPSEYLIENENLTEMLSYTDVLILNKEEINLLLQKQRKHQKNSFLGLAHFGPRLIIITDGKNKITCYDYNENKKYSLMPHGIKVVESTGAGDAFGAGFIAGLISGKSVFDSLKLGLRESESVLGAIGAHNNLLKFNLKKNGH